MKKETLVIGDGTDASWEWIASLAKIIPNQVNMETATWEENVIKHFPNIGTFWVQGVKRNPSLRTADIKIDAIPPEMLEVRGPIEPLLVSIATGIGLVCSAGGTAIFIDILKTWVEGKKGRRIRIKKDDFELEIEGFVTQKELEQLIDTFDKHFHKQTILRP